jgi:hypothetical protein
MAAGDNLKGRGRRHGAVNGPSKTISNHSRYSTSFTPLEEFENFSIGEDGGANDE